MENMNIRQLANSMFTSYLLDVLEEDKDRNNERKIANILEVGNSPADSISVHLDRNRYKQFLLSSKVTLEELQKYNIKGETGVVFKGEPRYLYNDRIGKIIPSFENMENVDALICRGISNEIRHAIYYYKAPIYVGNLVTNLSGESNVSFPSGNSRKDFYDNLYGNLVQELKYYREEDYVLEKKYRKDLDARYYLIHRKM